MRGDRIDHMQGRSTLRPSWHDVRRCRDPIVLKQPEEKDEKKRENQIGVEADILASWGAAVLRPYTTALRDFAEEIVRDEPLFAVAIIPEFGAGHEEDAPAHPPLFRVARTVGCREQRQ